VGRFALLLIIVAAALAGLQRRGRRKAGATKLSVPSTGLNSSQAEKRIFQMLDVDGDGRISREDFKRAHRKWLEDHNLAEPYSEVRAEKEVIPQGKTAADDDEHSMHVAGTPSQAEEPPEVSLGRDQPLQNASGGKERLVGRKRLELVMAKRQQKQRGEAPRDVTNRTFMSFEDVRWFPMAGIAGPCLIENDDEPHYPRPKQFKTCSVVGAAPSSRGSGAGPEIDSHEQVFRAGICTAAAIKKFSADIGKRIDYCVSFWEWDTLDPRSKSIIVMKALQWFDNMPRRKDWKKCHSNMLWTHPDFLNRIDEMIWEVGADAPLSPYYWANASIFPRPTCAALKVQWGGCNRCFCKDYRERLVDVSSGFYAVAVALELCQQVYLYGFDTDTSEHAFYGHLHNNPFKAGVKNEVKNERHAFAMERYIYRKLNSQGRVHLHHSTFGKAQPSTGRTGAPAKRTPGQVGIPAARRPKPPARARGSRKDDGSARYYLVGEGRCGSSIDEEPPHRMDAMWTRARKRAQEDRCARTPGCVGYHWNIEDQTGMLLNKEFNTTCCNTPKELCYMKVAPSRR